MLLCAGEALIDMMPRQSEAGDTVFVPLAGGAVFNTAAAAGRLGLARGFFSGLSTDLFGERLAAVLAGLADTGALNKDRIRRGLSDHMLDAALGLGVRAAALTVNRACANPPGRKEIP
ncbi:MAG: hypothetical protein RLZZ491_445 [Pseudomonadota bacterium]